MRASLVIYSLLGVTAVADLGRAFAEMQVHADLTGRLEVLEQDAVRRAAAEAHFTALPFDEAVAYFSRKQVMTPGELAALEDRYRAKGFGMASVHNRYALEAARTALGSAIADGLSERDTLKRVRSGFEKAGIDTPDAFHLQTAFDTSVLGAYQAGRYEQLTHPTILRARPLWRYRTVGDNRVRPSHRAMDGRAFPADADVWQTWYPPNGYRCRCTVESVSEREAQDAGLVVERELPRTIAQPDGTVVQMLPDPGFSGSPATQITADRVAAQIRTEADRLGVLRASAEDMNRLNDPVRAVKVDRFAGLTEDEVERELREHFAFNVHEPQRPPGPGELELTWAMYSQNLDTAEQLVSRLVQADGLYGLKDRISVGARASYLAAIDPKGWDDPELVHDQELAERLGMPAGQVAARSTEYLIRLRLQPSEATAVLDFLAQHGERGPENTPVRRAWDVQDVRVRAGQGAELPEHKAYQTAYRNARSLGPDRELVTLAQAPKPGFQERELVSLNRSLARYLP